MTQALQKIAEQQGLVLKLNKKQREEVEGSIYEYFGELLFLGEPCRYDGCSRLDRQVIELHKAGHTLVPVCPEVLGGLDTPRAPAEVQADGRVITEDGEDVTDAYRAGAEAALKIAREHSCTVAVLKARSPSCGCGRNL